MGFFDRTSGSSSRALHPSPRLRRIAFVASLALTVVISARPLAAVDCGECDLGCHLRTDAFALMEDYVEDKAAFGQRSGRCRAVDERWSEVQENLEALDQPPPPQEGRYRPVSKLELAMINHEIGIRSCMLLCGREEYRENCVGGPGGMSCDCKPGALPYCRSQSNRGVIETIAPSFGGDGGFDEQGSTPGPSRSEDAEAPEPVTDPDAAAEPRYLIEVAVTADGFEPDTVFAPCDFEPSSVKVSGQVVDDAGTPVSGAGVALVGLGARGVTDARGYYSMSALTEGDAPFVALRNVTIVRLVGSLDATVTPVSTVWANGREVEAVVAVTTDGLPLAGKEITISGWKGFTFRGNRVDYVTEGRSNNFPLRLDSAGQARFRFSAPVVPRDRAAALQDPASRFPVDGHFRVKVRGQDAETECSYAIESPFPRIGRIRVPGNVDAGLWQTRPSSIVIEDPDSGRFRVTVRGLGDFRTTAPGAAIKSGVLTDDLTGTQFEFLYRPPEGDFDPATAMPDVLDEFMNTSKNIYISVVTNVVGGMLVDEVKVVFPSGGLDKGLSKLGLQLDAEKLLDAGGNMANVVNLGSTTYLDLATISDDPGDTQKKIVAGGNYVIGVVDTSMGFAGTLGTAKQKLAWEAAKAYWEYIKLMNSVTGQYQEVANAYQGTVMHPIEVTVEDESGHRTTASRACSVRVWRGGSR